VALPSNFCARLFRRSLWQRRRFDLAGPVPLMGTSRTEKGMIRLHLLVALILAFPSTSSAAARCYSAPDDPGITVTADTDDIYTLVKRIQGRTTIMPTENRERRNRNRDPRRE
jgi:hypothetical protein